MVDSRPGIASAESIACPPVCVVGPPVSDGVASKSCRVGGGEEGGFLTRVPGRTQDACRRGEDSGGLQAGHFYCLFNFL